jgi:uncharacterized protein (TIGR02266 family)
MPSSAAIRNPGIRPYIDHRSARLRLIASRRTQACDTDLPMSCASGEVEGKAMASDDHSATRRYKRLEIRVPVRISTIEPERDPWTGRPFFRATHETSANLSRGGLCIHTAEPLRPGRRVLLEIELPDGRPVETLARVAWTRRELAPGTANAAGIGLEFLGGAADQLASLESFVAAREDGAASSAPSTAD